MELSRSSGGRLSVVGRWNEGRYKRGKEKVNLNKSTFLSLRVGWFVLGPSLVLISLNGLERLFHPWLKARNGQREYREKES